MITVVEACATVGEIVGAVADGDNALAHQLEDALRRDALLAVIEDSPDAKRLAEIAYGTGTIEFTRWYA